jgi:hypothetical protein
MGIMRSSPSTLCLCNRTHGVSMDANVTAAFRMDGSLI